VPIFSGGSRAENIPRITRNRAKASANQQLKARAIFASMLRIITRITRSHGSARGELV
jgi:hypothetical protein